MARDEFRFAGETGTEGAPEERGGACMECDREGTLRPKRHRWLCVRCYNLPCPECGGTGLDATQAHIHPGFPAETALRAARHPCPTCSEVRPVPRHFACADRYCVSGLTVETLGDVCEECAPLYHRADLAAEDARGRDLARQRRESR